MMVLKRRRATALENQLGHRFRRPQLLEIALTHRSFANEMGLPEHYERLEFLGDAVLGLVVCEWLFRQHPDLPEGTLSKLKSHVVSARSLARYARELGVGEALRLGVGEERSGGRRKGSLLADSMEAIFGAVYLDGGSTAARKVIDRLLRSQMDEVETALQGDAKTALQELAQGRGWGLPEYRVVAQEGPDHAKRFTVECWLGERVEGRGVGKSKKIAEQRAAAAALGSLDLTQTDS